MESKNTEQLKSLIEYCEAHPEERLWQCIRNWANTDVLFKANMTNKGEGTRVVVDGTPFHLKDTFYEE